MRARRAFTVIVGVLIVGELIAALLLAEEVNWSEAAAPVFIVATGLVGGVLGFRRGDNPIGWLLQASSFFMATGALTITYAQAAQIWNPGSLPMSPWVIWVSGCAFGLAAGVPATFLFLLFPSGRLPSPSWKLAPWFAGLGLAWMLAAVTFSGENFEDFAMSNPVALNESSPMSAILEVGFMVFLGGVVVSVASVIMRFKSSTGMERQQLKWVALGVVMGGTGAIIGSTGIPSAVGNFIAVASLTIVPVTIGLAILRYRLYDIDRIISRTVSYAAIVGLLGFVFAAGIVLIPNVVPGLEESTLLVAVSTLAVAALFNPLRRRVQRIVDRRFNRSRYDAERVMEGFAGSLRDRVEPDGVVGGWLGVVSDTMEPSSVGVWVK